jgi:hypothetical protein
MATGSTADHRSLGCPALGEFQDKATDGRSSRLRECTTSVLADHVNHLADGLDDILSNFSQLPHVLL